MQAACAEPDADGVHGGGGRATLRPHDDGGIGYAAGEEIALADERLARGVAVADAAGDDDPRGQLVSVEPQRVIEADPASEPKSGADASE